jgi:hypothetical protein
MDEVLDTFSWIVKVCEALLVAAVRVAVCVELNAETVAVKLACVALGCTITAAGTVTAGWLLERLTLNPLAGAGDVSASVQGFVPAAVMEALAQEKEVSAVTTGFSWIEKVVETVPALAVMTAVAPFVTEDTFA